MMFSHSNTRHHGNTLAARLALPLSVLLATTVPGQAQIVLHDVTAQTKIDFVHTDGSSGLKYIMETVCAGLALFDYDRDGDEDIYFLNGAPLKGTKSDTVPRNRLYRNDGDWSFTDVTSAARVGDTGYGMGVAAADYDNDGDLDLYVNNFGPNVFYRNNGDGTFDEVTEQTGTANGDKMGAGAVFLDMDGDGDLDLYVASYLLFTYETHVTSKVGDVMVYGGPRSYPPTPDNLYRNNGNGTFTDVSRDSGIAAHAGTGMGMVAADFDDDGDTDIYVANDRAGNFLFQNDGRGVFEEWGELAGVAYEQFGYEEGSMGVDCADYDNDGLLDLTVTSYQGESATLYRNLGGFVFEDVTQRSGAGAGSFLLVTWGNAFIDFDNDGDRDIFMVSGHTVDNIEQYDDRSTYKQPNILLMNDGQGKFVNVSKTSGDGLEVIAASRGAAFDDLDNDGDIDVVILNTRGRPTILRNDTPNPGHWLQVRLQGVQTNRDGVGARVKVTAGDLTQVDEVHSGRSYQSHFGMRLHFGLGERKHIDSIQVRWLGGAVEVFEDIDVDQVVILKEGTGKRQ